MAATRLTAPSLRLSILALAPVLSGCHSDPESPSSDAAVARTTPGDTTAAVPGAGEHPNEPAGLTRLAEWSGTSLFDAGGATSGDDGILAGKWSRSSGGLSTATDATAPNSPPGVIVYTWPAGLPPGTSPGTFSWWADDNATGYSKLYETGWIKIPSETFEQQSSGGLKLIGYWSSGRSNANNLFGWAAGVDSNPVSAFTFELRQQGFVTRDLRQNVSRQVLLTCGSWHQYEILMEVNAVGETNGKFQMWIDGTKTHDYSDVVYRTSSNSGEFVARRWDAVWGGAGGASKTRTDRLWIDGIYMSGAR